MPLHDYYCPLCKSVEERHTAVCDLHKLQLHKCKPDLETVMERVFLKAPVGFVQRDICYDSPIDGRPITSKQARIEDLARNGCIEYDPEMRKDAARRRQEADDRLDRAIEETVEAAVAVMDVRKQEKLAEELRGGASVEVTRPDGATLH